MEAETAVVATVEVAMEEATAAAVMGAAATAVAMVEGMAAAAMEEEVRVAAETEEEAQEAARVEETVEAEMAAATGAPQSSRLRSSARRAALTPPRTDTACYCLH